MTSSTNASRGRAMSFSAWPGMRSVCTAGGTSSSTWTLVPASWRRIDSLSMWIAALVALYVGVARSGVWARPLETVTIVDAGRVWRCSTNAATRRIGPRRFVVTIASASARNPGERQSSARMMPAMATSTFTSGCSAMTRADADAMLSASAVSIRTVWIPGCSAAIRSSSSRRRPPTMTVLPAAWRRRARARPIPLVAPGTKTVFRVMFMTPPCAQRPAPGRDLVIQGSPVPGCARASRG